MRDGTTVQAATRFIIAMRAAYPLAAPCCSAQRCCLPHVLSRPGPGFSRVPKRPLLTTAALKRTNNDNEGSTADSWLQQRSRLAVQFLKEQQAQWLYRYFRDWRKDAFRYLQLSHNIMNRIWCKYKHSHRGQQHLHGPASKQAAAHRSCAILAAFDPPRTLEHCTAAA